MLFAHARILTLDPLIGDFDRGDVLLGGSRIVGIGPGLLNAAGDDDMLVVDCSGRTIVPGVVDTIVLSGHRPERSTASGALAPGSPATFLVIDADPASAVDVVITVAVRNRSATALVIVDGRIAPLGPPRSRSYDVGSPVSETSEHLGTWIDENDFVHQHLTADGRYDETRGGREHAFQGSFWITGDRIDYLDDLGFWAYGEFVDGTLHHAGYTFHRS